jgi:hypothetical protein
VEYDSHIANLEGGVSGISCRLMLTDADIDRARSILADSNIKW